MAADPKQVKMIFLAALEKATAEERNTFLHEACGTDKELRLRADELLRAHNEPGELPGVPDRDRAVGNLINDSLMAFLEPSSDPGSLGRLDHYEVLDVIGRGGMSVVLRARDTKLERVVAIKVMAAPLSVTARQRFAREAKSAAAVRHEHVVAIYAVRDDGPMPYLVMECIDGCNLEALLRRSRPMQLDELLRIGIEVSSGLAAAHKQGLVHRDIKPANILLETGTLRVKLTDFGLARAVDDASLTQSGIIAGTPLYMSPEQAAGDPIDARADLFSFGSVLYEMCTGRAAFWAPSTVAVIRRVCDEVPQSIRAINPDIPKALCRIIERLHAKKPTKRPASAQEVADLLAGQLEINQGRSRLLSGAPAAQASPRQAKPARRWIWAAAALVLTCTGLALSEVAGFSNVHGTAVRMFSPEMTPVENVVETGVADASDSWEKSVAALPAERQVDAVSQRLKELNPRFNGKLAPTTKDGVVMGLEFFSDEVEDLSPVRALQGLRVLACGGNGPGQGKVKSLAALRGLRLTHLNFRYTRVDDLSPLRGMPLEDLGCHGTWVSDITPLEGMRLKALALTDTQIADLTPLRGMPLWGLDLHGARRVSDLRPLKGMPLTYLNLSYGPVTDLSVIASLKSLNDLILTGVPVTDLAPLRGLSLTRLGIKGTRVTDVMPLKGLPLDFLELDYRPEYEGVLRSLTRLREINHRPTASFWKDVSK